MYDNVDSQSQPRGQPLCLCGERAGSAAGASNASRGPLKPEVRRSAEPSTDHAGIALAVNARQDHDETRERSIPKDVGESPQQSTAGTTIPIGVCKRIVRDPCDDSVHRFAELMTETRLLPVVPVLDSRQVELGRSTDENRQGQRRRCSRRALTSGHGL